MFRPQRLAVLAALYLIAAAPAASVPPPTCTAAGGCGEAEVLPQEEGLNLLQTDVRFSGAAAALHRSPSTQPMLGTQPDPTIQAALLTTFACMGLSTCAFLLMSQESTKRFNYVAMAVTGIATMAYLSMWCGAGIVEVQGRNVYYMRYIDWFFTTPFFLFDLALLASADTWDTFYVMLLNALCIVAGAIAAIVPAAKFPLFAFGMLTFIMFNMKLFGAMLSKAGAVSQDVRGKYFLVTALTMSVWCIYPVMFWLCEVTRTLSIQAEVVSYGIIDVTAKCVCSYILLRDAHILEQVK